MKSTPNLSNIEPGIVALFKKHPDLASIIKALSGQAGASYLVGGAVRDIILGLPVHDLDIEVHFLSLDQIAQVLQEFGSVNYVGKSFGVLKLENSPIDWSLPRTDAPGRKPYVSIDPQMGIYEALRRRDLTMNAMAVNLLSYEFIDPFHGFNDLQQGILRSPDPVFFTDDPLRFYRVMQFIGRFAMQPDDTLNTLCSKMNIANVSLERIEDEYEKLLLLSQRPSLGFRWLVQINRIHELLPELAHTQGVLQNPQWHPEVEVFEHVMQTIDAAAALPLEKERLTLLYAALCHDLGKVSTTIIKDGTLRSPGHAHAGVAYTKALMKRMTLKKTLMQTVGLLVKYHMEPVQFVKLNSSLAAYRRLALKLAPSTNLALLLDLALADQRGRNSHGHKPLTSTPSFIKIFQERAELAGALQEAEKPLLRGRDIMDLVKPGPRMGKLLRYAYEEQLRRGIKDKKQLRALVVEKLK